jgi:hypothetical protein
MENSPESMKILESFKLNEQNIRRSEAGVNTRYTILNISHHLVLKSSLP